MLVSMMCNSSGVVRYVAADSVNPASPYTNWATAAIAIQDAVDVAVDGDQILVTNGLYATGGRAFGFSHLTNRVTLDKRLTLQSVNGPQFTVIQGGEVPGSTNDNTPIRCVYLTPRATLSGFTLTNGVAKGSGGNGNDPIGGGALCDSTYAIITNCVLIANSADVGGGGVYGATLNKCVLSGNSGGGARFSVLNGCTLVSNYMRFEGGGAVNCTLNDCTLTDNRASFGGGAESSTLNRCVLTGNFASEDGGAADGGTLNNCILSGNSASGRGGGANFSQLNNCLVFGNWATLAGGTWESSLTNCTVVGNAAQSDVGASYGGTMVNCIVYYNTATNGVKNSNGSMSYCCTTPAPVSGIGNITNEPVFVNLAGGDFHLQTNSPCINAGNNTSVLTNADLDGNPRIVGGTVDIGAYEFQTPASTISYAWLEQYGLPITSSTDSADPDADGLNNRQEWMAGTDPTNAQSVLKMLPPLTSRGQATLRWQSVTNRSYFIERSAYLSAQPPFYILATNITGQSGTTSYTYTSPGSLGTAFYRVGVQ